MAVTLVWGISSNAREYEVLRGTVSGFWPSIVGTTGSNYFTDDTVEINTQYYYQVLAVNSSGSTLAVSQTEIRTANTFEPDQISDLSLWLDATDEDSFTLGSMNQVSSWLDRSSNGYVVSQAAELNQPTLASDVIAGNSAVRFSYAGSAMLQIEGSPTFIFSDSPWTLAWVAQCDIQNAVFNGLFNLLDDYGNAFGFVVGYSNNSSYSTVYLGDSSSGGPRINLLSLPDSTGWHSFILSYNGSDKTMLSNYGITVDGAPGTLSTGVGGRGGGNPVDIVGTDSNDFFNGYLMEMLLYGKALSDSEVTLLADWLIQKVS